MLNKIRFVRLLELGRRLTEEGKTKLLARGDQGWSAVDLELAGQVGMLAERGSPGLTSED